MNTREKIQLPYVVASRRTSRRIRRCTIKSFTARKNCVVNGDGSSPRAKPVEYLQHPRDLAAAISQALAKKSQGQPQNRMTARIGTAGWAIPRAHHSHFPHDGTQLARYAQIFPVVEINSTFRREHRETTFARWAESTPDGFRFSLKLPKSATHEDRLQGPLEPVTAFLSGVRVLGPKLGPILIQLPPSLAFEHRIAETFLGRVRAAHAGPLVVEPRHPSWFTDRAEALFGQEQIARVAADPAVVPDAGIPGGWDRLRYYRLHGSPRKYFSAYDDGFISRVAEAITDAGDVWCIFDNTASGAAAGNAITLLSSVPPRSRPYLHRPAI